jgi:hypothetical protein
MAEGVQTFSHCAWTFRWRSEDSISGRAQLEALSGALALGSLPLPEMTYCTHFVEALHPGTGLRLRFTAAGALASWHALQCSNSALVGADGARLPVDVTSHDFTYTNEYDGECSLVGGDEGSPGAPVAAAPSDAAIPLDLISQRTPILAFAAAPLYGSDLNDRGVVEVGVKLRVMDTYFLVLCRSFTRIDRDRVRLRDVRYFHAFAPAQPLRVLRDVQLRLGSVAQVSQAAAAGRPPLQLHRAMGSPVSPVGAGSSGAGGGGGGGGGWMGSGGATGSATGPPLPQGLPSFFADAAAAAVAAAAPPGDAALSPSSPQQQQAHPAALASPAAPHAASPPPLAFPSPPRAAVHPVVLASMRERAERQGLRVLDDGTHVSAAGGEACSAPGAGGSAPADFTAVWPARPGATQPPPLSPVALLQCEGPLPLLAVSAEDAFKTLAPQQRQEELLV